MTATIRYGDLADVSALLPVMSAAFDPLWGEAWTGPQCAAALAIPGSSLFIAELDGKAVGFALVRSVLDEAELLLLATLPARRKVGLGRQLLEKVIVHLQRKQVRSLFLEVRLNNEARYFYARLGFREIGRRNNYYRSVAGQYADAVTLGCDIIKSEISGLP